MTGTTAVSLAWTKTAAQLLEHCRPSKETSFAPHGARAGLMDGGDSRTDDTLPRPGCQTISGSARHATWHWRTTEGAN